MFLYKYEIFVLFILMLKVCNTKSQRLMSKTGAQLHTQTIQQETNNTAVSSYFRHDPYGPNTYAFGYEVDDKNTHNVQFRDERRYLNGTIVGSYGYVRPDGRVTLTRYLADKEHGFHSHTDLFQPGEEQKVAAARWPSFISDIKTTNASPNHSQQHQHNMLSNDVIQAAKEQHGIDLSNKDTKNNIHPHHDPTIADLVNGEVPLSLLGDNKSSVLGFETVNKFIPQDFPIVPFELPTHLAHHAESEAATTTTTTTSSYDHAKENNSEKAVPNELLHRAVLAHSSQLIDQHERKLQNQTKLNESHARQKNQAAISPKPLTDSESEHSSNATWYHKVINDARKEFLQNLPSLQ